MDKRLIWVLAFSVGICTVLLQRSLMPATILVALSVISIGLFIEARGVIFSAFILGSVWGNVASHHALEQRVSSADFPAQNIIIGTVMGVPQRRGGLVRFDFQTDQTVTKEGDGYPSRRVRLRWYETDEAPVSGERWRFNVRLHPPRGYRNRHGFDYEYYLLRSGIHGTGYVLEGERYSKSNGRIWSAVDRFRSRFKESLEGFSAITNKGILTALAVGERSGIDSETRQLLRESGLSHLVAISGLHIGLAGLFAYGIASGLWRVFPWGCQRVPAHFSGWAMGVTTALGYAFVAGFPISTIRAFVMVLTGAFLSLSCTKTSPENLLAVAMLFVSCLWPLSVPSPGFWLSFSAVWLIFRFLPERHSDRFEELGGEKHTHSRFMRVSLGYFIDLTKLQLILLIGMSPLLAFCFGEIPLSAPVTNLLAVPAFAFWVVPSALTALGVHLLGYSHWIPWVLWPADQVITGIVWTAKWFSQANLSVIRATPNVGAILLIGVGVIFIGKLGAKKLGAMLLGLGIFWSGNALLGKDQLNFGEFNIAMLDVGQGLAVVVTTRQHVLVYDFGPRFGDFSLGEAVVLPHILGENLSNIDAAVLSHGANDHVGGFPAVADQFEIRRQFSGDPKAVEGISCHTLPQPNWTWDGVDFTFLNSRPANVRNENDFSCVLQIKGEHGSALLTGDIEMAAEAALVKRYGMGLSTDVLQIPHHGSKTSSTNSFLKATSPDYALLSRGRRNRFRHPSREVINRYDIEQIHIWDTAKEGQIDLQSTGRGWEVRTFSAASARFWH